MSLAEKIKKTAAKAIEELHKVDVFADDIVVSQTKPEFEGDYTIVLFSLVKRLSVSPVVFGKELGDAMVANNPGFIKEYNLIKGFLNLSIHDNYFTQFLNENISSEDLHLQHAQGRKVIVEYSSPNTNKPLHLGHLRNIFLGWSVAEILKATGNEVTKTCIVNDRGIHICKSMIAWQRFGSGAEPSTEGIKGDHFVGDYYVRFNDEYKNQTAGLIEQGLSKDEAEKEAQIMKDTQQMLVDWEKGKPEVVELWNKMNGWVYAGFDETYKRIGIDFKKHIMKARPICWVKNLLKMDCCKVCFTKKKTGVYG